MLPKSGAGVCSPATVSRLSTKGDTRPPRSAATASLRCIRGIYPLGRARWSPPNGVRLGWGRRTLELVGIHSAERQRRTVPRLLEVAVFLSPPHVARQVAAQRLQGVEAVHTQAHE